MSDAPSPARAAYLARRHEAHKARLDDFLRIDRSCAVCGTTLQIRPGEKLSRFQVRLTCSPRCANRVKGLAMVATKRRLGLQKPKLSGIWPPGISFAEHESAAAAADTGSSGMPSVTEFRSFVGTSAALCAEHRWAGL